MGDEKTVDRESFLLAENRKLRELLDEVRGRAFQMSVCAENGGPGPWAELDNGIGERMRVIAKNFKEH